MRVAIISDIHGNAFALDAALADLRGVGYDQMVCLGDAIQGGAQPAQTVSRLRELTIPIVMGNADAWLLTGVETGKEKLPPDRAVVRDWSLSQLSDEDKAFIQGFQPTVKVDLGSGKSLLCFHGSPTSFDDIILPDTPIEEIEGFLGAFKSSFLTGGHTHVQNIRRLGETFYFNPGSVGFAYFHHQPEDNFKADAWAEYALLTVEGSRVSLEFRRVPYDGEAVIQIYLSSGRPYAEEAANQYR
jgi:predicted phosphodiesterase